MKKFLDGYSAQCKASGEEQNAKNASFLTGKFPSLVYKAISKGVRIRTEKKDALEEMKKPHNNLELKKFGGFFKYFRKFLPGFCKLKRLFLKNLEGRRTCKRGRYLERQEWFKWTRKPEDKFLEMVEQMRLRHTIAFVGLEDHLLLEIDASDKDIKGCMFKIKKIIDEYRDLEEMLDDMQIVAFF
jgi:hypothetical protein